MSERQCTRCHIWKSISTEFYNSKRTECKDCTKEKSKERQKEVSGKVVEMLKEILENQSTIMEKQERLEKELSTRMDNMEILMDQEIGKLLKKIKKLSACPQ